MGRVWQTDARHRHAKHGATPRFRRIDCSCVDEKNITPRMARCIRTPGMRLTQR